MTRQYHPVAPGSERRTLGPRRDIRLSWAVSSSERHALALRSAELENENAALRGELSEIQDAWTREHNAGGQEPEPALTCMLLALHTIRGLQDGMTSAINTLIAERDKARNEANEQRARAERAEQTVERQRAAICQWSEGYAKIEQELERIKGAGSVAKIATVEKSARADFWGAAMTKPTKRETVAGLCATIRSLRAELKEMTTQAEIYEQSSQEYAQLYEEKTAQLDDPAKVLVNRETLQRYLDAHSHQWPDAPEDAKELRAAVKG